MARLVSGRVKKKPQTGLTSDRYQFLELDQAEPDLGDTLVGPSSIGVNPAPISGNQYVLIANQNQLGKRYWVPTTNLSTGLIPGSFSVFNNDIQVGLANSFNKFNFVGTGVTVDVVGFANSEQTGIATVRIIVRELIAPGNLNTIPYHSSTGLLDGAPDFVYVNGSVGLGTTTPGEKLQVDGNIRVGISTTSNYIAFRGTYLDNQTPYTHTYIGERIYDYSGLGEKSELLLFKGNDVTGSSGPDRIRLAAGEFRFDTLGIATA